MLKRRHRQTRLAEGVDIIIMSTEGSYEQFSDCLYLQVHVLLYNIAISLRQIYNITFKFVRTSQNSQAVLTELEPVEIYGGQLSTAVDSWPPYLRVHFESVYRLYVMHTTTIIA